MKNKYNKTKILPLYFDCNRQKFGANNRKFLLQYK